VLTGHKFLVLEVSLNGAVANRAVEYELVEYTDEDDEKGIKYRMVRGWAMILTDEIIGEETHSFSKKKQIAEPPKKLL